MPKVLGHTNISSEDAKKLFVFFESQSKHAIKIWKAGTTYTFHDNTSFSFRSTVIQRARKEGKTGVRYEFISNRKIGGGCTSTIYRILSTLAIDETGFLFKNYGSRREEPLKEMKSSIKKRVVKVQRHVPEHPVSRAPREYVLANRAGYLAIKPPTIIEDTSYTVMKKLDGKDLSDIIDLDYKNIQALSIEQRLELSNVLLRALKYQVTDKGIIHGDIKGTNIMINMSQNPISVIIYDYGFSVPTEDPGHDTSGSLVFAPPEIFVKGLKTPKIDVYSMARVIAMLWRIDLSSYETEDIHTAVYNASKVNLDSLFRGIEGLSDANKQIIKSTLNAMLEADSTMRMSIEGAITEFAHIQHPNPISVCHQAHLDDVGLKLTTTPPTAHFKPKGQLANDLFVFFGQPAPVQQGELAFQSKCMQY